MPNPMLPGRVRVETVRHTAMGRPCTVSKESEGVRLLMPRRFIYPESMSFKFFMRTIPTNRYILVSFRSGNREK